MGRRYDHIEEIDKFNPYHDRLGRFSGASGAASFSATPGKSRAHDLAIEREVRRHKGGAGSVAVQGPTPQQGPKQPPKPKKRTPDLRYDRLPYATLFTGYGTPEEKKQKRDTITRFIREAEVGNVYETGGGVGSAGGAVRDN